jgi:hypothetical protein
MLAAAWRAVVHCLPPLIEFGQLAEPVPDSRYLGFIQEAGRLFPIAGDKGHRGAVAKQGRGGRRLPDLYVQFLGNCFQVLVHGFITGR